MGDAQGHIQVGGWVAYRRSPTDKNFFLDDQDPFTFSFEKFMSRKPCSRSVDSRREDTTGMELTEEAGQYHLACSCAKKLNSQRFEIQLCKTLSKTKVQVLCLMERRAEGW